MTVLDWNPEQQSVRSISASRSLFLCVTQWHCHTATQCHTVTLCHSTVVQGLNHVASVAVQHSSHGDIRDDKIAKFAICDRKCAAWYLLCAHNENNRNREKIYCVQCNTSSLFTLCNGSLFLLFSLKVSNQFFINWRHLPFSEFLDNPSQTSFPPSRVVVDRRVGSCVGQIVVGLAVVVVPVVVDVWNCVLSCVACADGRSVVVRVGEGHVGRGIWGEKFQPQDLIFTQLLSMSPKRHFKGTSHHSQCHRHLPLHLHNTVHLIYLILLILLDFLVHSEAHLKVYVYSNWKRIPPASWE